MFTEVLFRAEHEVSYNLIVPVSVVYFLNPNFVKSVWLHI